MIDIFIKLSLLFLLIMFIKNILDMNKYNKNSTLISIDDISELEENKIILDPVLISYQFNKDILIKELIDNNPIKYFKDNQNLIRFNDFNINKDIFINKNKELFDELNCQELCDKIYKKFKLFYSSNNNYFASIFQGNNITKINKNKHNICVIGCLNGKCNIYLYNPKHVDYLENKNNKKWAIQVNLLNNNLLYIPSNWFYNIETEEDCILFHIDADNYFTSIYNEYRE